MVRKFGSMSVCRFTHVNLHVHKLDAVFNQCLSHNADISQASSTLQMWTE